MTIMTELTGTVGFGAPMTEKTFAKRRRAGVELAATLALAVSLMIAATAVSIGMARAQVLHTAHISTQLPVSVAVFLGAVMAGKIH
jgi:uncharacterized membrane protein affecting hemolysin expression